MRPDLKDAHIDARQPQAQRRPAANDPDAERPVPGGSPQPVRPLRSASEPRLNERLGQLLLQKKGPDAVMLGVLAVALFLGLIGLAVHFLWIVAIIVMALGLGFIIADSRRDRIDIVNRRSETADAS